MIVYPAIDLKDGICVRLMHGRFDQVTHYDDNPAARLAAFAAAGATWAHIVDLDGAEAGRAVQHALIGNLARTNDIHIQSGGGVRSADDVAALQRCRDRLDLDRCGAGVAEFIQRPLDQRVEAQRVETRINSVLLAHVKRTITPRPPRPVPVILGRTGPW